MKYKPKVEYIDKIMLDVSARTPFFQSMIDDCLVKCDSGTLDTTE
jgi:hypothetical protein